MQNPPALTLRMGCARDSGSLRSFAQGDDDLVVAFDYHVPERRNETRAKAQEVVGSVQAKQASGRTLGQALAERARDHSVGLYPPADAGNYDGRIEVAGDSIVIVLPDGQIGTSASWWQKFISGGVGLAVTVVASAICLVAFAPGAPVAAPVCGAVGGGIGGFVTELMNAYFDEEDFKDPDVWGGLLATAFWGAAGGAFGGSLVKWASDSAGTFVTELQTSLRALASRLGAYANPLVYLSDRLSQMVPSLIARLQQLHQGIGNSTPLRVMVVGDSMTQGYEGDWTWRYRLWEWFRDQNVAVDFVGPYKGTKAQAPAHGPSRPPLQGENPGASLDEPDTSGGYAQGADPAFDSDHFGVWGRQAMQDKKLIRGMVAQYKPDLILVGLGFNDMGWFVSGPGGTLDSMKTLVDEARAARGDVKFALADVPQRTFIDGRDDLPVSTSVYNAALRKQALGWSTLASPVKVVNWSGSYDCGRDACPGGYDGLHPNALGEFQIARAFEQTLHHEYGIGQSVPGIPGSVPARPLGSVNNVVAASSDLGVTVTWDRVYGARGYTVRSRLVGLDTWNEGRVSTNRLDTTWTEDGWEWEYQVRVDNQSDGTSAWSPVVRATARPRTAAAPTDIITVPTATGVDVVWQPAKGPHSDSVERYQILTWDKDTPGSWLGSTAVQGNSVHIDDLKPGHRYLIAVVSWNAAGGGMPRVARDIIVGAGRPAAPTNLSIMPIDAASVHLKWNASPQSTGYRVWIRNRTENGPWKAGESFTEATEQGVGFLFPGNVNFEFAVTAINGSTESVRSNVVALPNVGTRSGPATDAGPVPETLAGPDSRTDLRLLHSAPLAPTGAATPLPATRP
ncbi:fibronectin type III domain-containing protein [Streptomyces sp. OUCMDZ-4982]|uniref:fibronectin type III domain-containing protein n=1 Tax=Streptomyces sp. OUCMDZ-4982 TaxID=2973090 RepID=UPI00215C0972|nr:fibronectin type III domain-containing protein [Streptomyces sp. OUCMDZ-4982]MCR8945160.1 fibronectin type III domain-containing protein [Streptomyces sp. OUCMDZ-4982]